ncbi:hypothetical protein BH11MYX1_BH11MYX1_23050 [soil metagenome]
MARALFIAISLMISVTDVGAHRAASRLIYLNRRGASLRPGINDSRAQTSSVVPHPIDTASWAVTDDDWATTTSCLNELWARFDVEFTDRDPGDVPHLEALFGGSPTDYGLASNLTGVSPFAADCGVIENSIVFTFTDNLPNDPRRVCEVMAQELGHSYGLDHELLASEVMSQLADGQARSFRDQDVACGESQARPCGSSTAPCRATQNSVQLLRARLGDFGGDDLAPSIVFGSPAANATVAPGFAIAVAASDDVAVASLSLSLGGQPLATTSQPTLAWASDPQLAPGLYTFHVEAVDTNGNATDRDLTVEVAASAGCSATGQPSLGIAIGLVTLRRRRRATHR